MLWASSFPFLATGVGGCAATRSLIGGGGGEAALLVPTSGQAAALGQNMGRAASMVIGPGGTQPPKVYDTQDTPAGARSAARMAIDGGARMLFGPLRADQTPEVLAEAGRVPVVTFSNDDLLAGQGAFVMGLTPAQSVATMFSYARAQGLSRVAVLARPGPLGEASVKAARELAAAGGLTLTAALLRDEASGSAAALRSAGGGKPPEAVFLPDGGEALVGFAEALSGSGARLMGGVQWGILDAAAVPALAGSWFAAPSPDPFVGFMDTFETRFGEQAGLVTALGYDAALTAATLAADGTLDRSGLTREAGFSGALGKFRFLADGRCQRDLAVLTIEKGEIVTIGEVTGT